MADNAVFQGETPSYPPTDLQVATDKIGGIDHQYTKVEFGADGSATPVSASDPLPVTDASGATSAKQDTLIGYVDGIETLLGGVATSAKQDTEAVLVGAVNETAPASDTASSGINGRLQRIAQRLSSIIALLPTSLGAGGGLKVDGSGTALPVSGTVTANLAAGTNAIGKLAANSGVDIGDVDITSIAAGTNRIGSVVARLDQARIAQTPTISAGSIYASGDAVGGLLTFANAADTSGGTITVTAVVIVDADQELAPLELVLFDRTFTATSDNAVFAPSDADLANVVGVIKVSNYANFSTNSVATRECRLTATLNGTSLFGQLVVRGTPTYTATTDLTVIVQTVQD